MYSLDLLRDLSRHMEWADREVWDATAPLTGPVDERLRTLLLHIHVVQRAFLDVWIGRPVLFPEERDFASLADVCAWSQAYYPELDRFLGTLDPSGLAEPVTMPWVAEYEQRVGRTFSTPTLAETIFQVTSHSTYHRGQVNARLRELGAVPPLVDYIAWVWSGRPIHNKTAATRV